ncbi:hypothetical protein J6590_018670 [Homalodisca vitripennis]|nr:hypothetical protein J6590_018670 [Homalodisca vitripennis]
MRPTRGLLHGLRPAAARGLSTLHQTDNVSLQQSELNVQVVVQLTLLRTAALPHGTPARTVPSVSSLNQIELSIISWPFRQPQPQRLPHRPSLPQDRARLTCWPHHTASGAMPPAVLMTAAS